MTLANILSRAYLKNEHSSERFNEDIVHAVNSVINNLPISDPKLEAIQLAGASDPTMVDLQSTITSGWPENRSEVSQELRLYWNFRDELSTTRGIILKGEKVVIPHSLRKEMLDKIHTAHLSIVKCKKKNKQKMLYSGQGWVDIENLIKNCETCLHAVPSLKHQRNHDVTIMSMEIGVHGSILPER